MGWISKRRHRTGRGLGRYDRNSPKHGAPLRKIAYVIRAAESMFEQDRVMLECGHETNSNGQYRARCPRCAREIRRDDVIAPDEDV
ncbi:MAG TPA: hypothetical protein VJZ91_10430 [Blastocatellia bacterium]|nr:hypothetical protein [Blastocatellia bacterium]